MRKIFVSKNDDVAEIVEKIISEPDSEIVLVIPKNALVEESVSNFHLIRREATAAGKNILIESVDEGILALAKASRIEATHPLFRKKQRSSSISDIVPAGKEDEDAEEEQVPDVKPIPRSKIGRSVAKEPVDEFEEEEPLKRRISGSWFSKGKIIAVVAVVIVIGGGIWLSSLFSRAEISINFKKVPWQYQNSIVAKTSVSAVSADSAVLPAEVLTQSKNLTQTFPASGRANVNEKATGKITVYNAYSSSPQPLVFNTRFLTPDGKLFRLVKSITVPGAQVKDGKIIPSTIETDVIADKAGPAYNLGPIDKLTIPGFKGSPKYQAFYGSLIKASGGFVGEKAVPTDKDISAAKDKVSELLKTSLSSDVLNNRPKDLKILDEATSIKTTKLSVNKVTDESGNFSVTGEAKFDAIGFKEDDLKAYLLSLAVKDNPGMVFESLKIDYSQIKADLSKEEIDFSASATGSLTQDFSPDNFKNQIVGKKIYDVRSLVLSLPGLADAKVSIWPSWISKIPKNPEKTKILIK